MVQRDHGRQTKRFKKSYNDVEEEHIFLSKCPSQELKNVKKKKRYCNTRCYFISTNLFRLHLKRCHSGLLSASSRISGGCAMCIKEYKGTELKIKSCCLAVPTYCHLMCVILNSGRLYWHDHLLGREGSVTPWRGPKSTGTATLTMWEPCLPHRVEHVHCDKSM